LVLLLYKIAIPFSKTTDVLDLLSSQNSVSKDIIGKDLVVEDLVRIIFEILPLS